MKQVHKAQLSVPSNRTHSPQPYYDYLPNAFSTLCMMQQHSAGGGGASGSMSPGTRTPGSITPGRCTPVTLSTPGRCTPVTFNRSYYSEVMAASTASTVAIDNKIEQAMDLVKSHLMFAVREEVDVLKERIVELMDRIKHLECENTMLRQYASPEVLQQIQSQMPMQLQQQPPQSHHSSS